MNQPQRNFEKETEFLQLQLLNALSDKAMFQAMLDDALAELNQYKNNDNQEVAE